MALWSGSAAYSTGVLWGPAAPPPILISLTEKPKKINNTMARKYFYPKKVAEQSPWHINYAEQVLLNGVGIGLVLADVTASANDSKQLAYAIGSWLEGARTFSKGARGRWRC